MKLKTKRILAISGSTRANSTNEIILKLIIKLYQETLDIQIFEGIDTLPHFNPDVSDESVSDNVKNFRALVDQCDAVIICTPEYVFSLPGSLKNAIEWTVSTTVFSHKPVGLIVASSVGEKALESLTLVMKTIEANIPEQGTLLIKGAKSKFNTQGQITDEHCLQQIMNLVNSLIETIDGHKNNKKVNSL